MAETRRLVDDFAPTVPFPTTYEDFEGRTETTRMVEVHLNCPSYLEKAKLGMKMGRYFNSVELTDWNEPTKSQPGTYTFRFYRSETETNDGISLSEIGTDDMPF